MLRLGRPLLLLCLLRPLGPRLLRRQRTPRTLALGAQSLSLGRLLWWWLSLLWLLLWLLLVLVLLLLWLRLLLGARPLLATHLLLLSSRLELRLELVDLLAQIELLFLARRQDLEQPLELGLGLFQFVPEALELGPQLVAFLLEASHLLLKLHQQLLLPLALLGSRWLLLLLLLLLDLLRQVGQLLALRLEGPLALVELLLVVLELVLLRLEVLAGLVLLAPQVGQLALEVFDECWMGVRLVR